MSYDYFCTVEDRRCLFHEEEETTENCSRIFIEVGWQICRYIRFPDFCRDPRIHSRPIQYYGMLLNFSSANKGETITGVALLPLIQSRRRITYKIRYFNKYWDAANSNLFHWSQLWEFSADLLFYHRIDAKIPVLKRRIFSLFLL